ncbi:MAG: trehalase family glycosidase [Candidatus Limivivens sp.]|nr:trehalase family glycosidase [Candidatus Limivivens sp.]
MENIYYGYAENLRNYIKEKVPALLKEPRSFIHYPFIDPGSVYDGNVWDWDTYWSVYGLLGMMDSFDPSFQEKILVHARGNVRNFLDHQLEDGYIPMMIEVKDWPEPYLNMKHKEGVLMNMHKPFLCSQICLISDYTKDYEWVHGDLEKLEKYFACYDANYYFENCGLYVWCDDIMIGMDNDPASFGRPKFSTANIFLNSFMVHELNSMAQILEQFGQTERAAHYRGKSDALTAAIQAECWDKRDQFFYSVDVDIRTRKFDWFHEGLGVFWKTLPIKIRVWSGFIPMWAGFATREQAESLVRHWKDDATFNTPFGITTLAKDEKMFDLSVTNNPSNWLGPVWLVANYIVFRGFLDYGFLEEAEDMCCRTLRLLGEDLEKTGSLHEYYNPFNGEPIMNGGFINWNILALNMVKELETRKI